MPSAWCRVGWSAAEPGQPPAAWSRILASPQNGDALALHDETVGRAGVRVSRPPARWIDGSIHRWVGRRKGTGRREGASGLRFDTVEPA